MRTAVVKAAVDLSNRFPQAMSGVLRSFPSLDKWLSLRITEKGVNPITNMFRTGIVKDGTLYVQAAAGVVADSDAESEFEETQRKAAGMFRAIEVAAQQEDW